MSPLCEFLDSSIQQRSRNKNFQTKVLQQLPRIPFTQGSKRGCGGESGKSNRCPNSLRWWPLKRIKQTNVMLAVAAQGTASRSAHSERESCRKTPINICSLTAAALCPELDCLQQEQGEQKSASALAALYIQRLVIKGSGQQVLDRMPVNFST